MAISTDRLDAQGFMDALNSAPNGTIAPIKPVVETNPLPGPRSTKIEPIVRREQPVPAPEETFTPYSQRKFANIVEKDKYWKELEQKHGVLVKGRTHYLDLYNKPIPPMKAQSFEIPEGNTWKKLIDENKDIENKPLFYASLMNEGAEALSYPNENPDDDLTGLSGFHFFGLDTIGTKSKEFEDKGYLPKGFSQKIIPFETENEKGQPITSAAFQNIQDAITAKNAFWKSGQANTDQSAKELGVQLSPQARDFFTIVSYNYGENGARQMMKDYFDKGLFRDEMFLEDSFIPKYEQVWKNAKQRMIVADMIQQEEFGKKK
jgi:hypothetical protein